mgnify:CR=1 FL=1
MVSGDLSDVIPYQIQSAVSYICNIKVIFNHGCGYDSRTHTAQFFVFCCLFQHSFVCCFNCTSKYTDRISFSASFNMTDDHFGRIAGCHIACLMSSHTVRNDQKVRQWSYRSVRSKHKILVRGSFLPYICNTA